MNIQGTCQLLEKSAERQRWLSAHTSQEGARPGFGIVAWPGDSHSTVFSVPRSVSLELPWKQGG